MLPLVALALYLRFPPGPRPDCNRAIEGTLQMWSLDHGRTNTYPNAGGDGDKSLAELKKYFGNGLEKYGYMPGLRFDDPPNLVLMYLKQKTRHTWHADVNHSIFTRPRWYAISPAIMDGASAEFPEGGRLLETAEFKARLLNTVAFLKEHQRPNWQTVANETSNFLASIQK